LRRSINRIIPLRSRINIIILLSILAAGGGSADNEDGLDRVVRRQSE
jgi:hypothetical protein